MYKIVCIDWFGWSEWYDSYIIVLSTFSQSVESVIY